MKTPFIFIKHLVFISFIYYSNILNASDAFIRDLFEEVKVGPHYIALAQKFFVKISEENQALLVKIAKTAFPENNDWIYKRADAIQYIVENCGIKSLKTINIIHELLLANTSKLLDYGLKERPEKFGLLVKKGQLLSEIEKLDIEPRILKGVPYNDAAVKIVECLEDGLNLRKTRNSTLPYLETEGDLKPLQMYLELGNALYASQPPLTPKDSLPLWGLLAKAYLKVTLEAFKEEEQVDTIFDQFMPEIRQRIRRNKMSYTWFSLFMDRLSIAMTKPTDRGEILGFNTGFDAYKQALITYKSYEWPLAWYFHRRYKRTCQEIGSEYTRNVLSPLALSNELFPDIVMLPYPFELSAKDIVMTMPHPETSHIWLTGFALDDVYADGAKMTPAQFMTHDQQHLGLIVWYLSFSNFFYPDYGDNYGPAPEDHWDYVKQARQLYFRSLERLQRMITNNTADEDQASMNAFIAFTAVHENIWGLWGRLSSFVKLESNGHFIKPGKKKLKNLMDKNYYLDLLSKTLREQVSNPEEFIKTLKKYVEEFIEEFVKLDRDNLDSLASDIQRWLKRGIKATSLENRSFSDYGYQLCEVTNQKGKQLPKSDSSVFQKQHDALPDGARFFRYYFFDSTLYCEDAIPPYVREEFYK